MMAWTPHEPFTDQLYHSPRRRKTIAYILNLTISTYSFKFIIHFALLCFPSPMALETFLIKLKNAISSKPTSQRQTRSTSPPITTTSSVGVLSFEVARLMTKLLHLTHSLTDSNLLSLRDHSLSLEGLTKIVTGDETFHLSLVCAELADSLAHTADSVSRLSYRCTTPSLRSFHRLFHEFADMGRDPHGWVISCKDTESKKKKIER